ncbi:hypothetical protein D3C81_1442310 [compost metagenome]
MAQTPDTHHTDFATGAGVPMLQRRIGGDAGTQQRRHRCQLRLGMANAQHVALVDDNLLRVASERPTRGVRRREVIGADHAVAVVLQTTDAVLTLLAAIDDAADANQLAKLEARDMRAYCGHPPDDFVARHAGELGSGPLRPDLMQIGVADAAIRDVDLHVMGAGTAAGDFHRLQRLVAGICAVGINRHEDVQWSKGGCGPF